MGASANSRTKVAKGINRRLPPIEITEQLKKRFWSKVDKKLEHECWPWLASIRSGYGAFRVAGRVYSGHRVSYVLTHGEPEPGLIIGHKCDNRVCCNPAHLEAISVVKNNRDAVLRGEACRPRGEQVHNAILTEDIVRQILSMHVPGVFSTRRISLALGLKVSTVKHVIEGTGWRHVSESFKQQGANHVDA